jgi:hypothetical protein
MGSTWKNEKDSRAGLVITVFDDALRRANEHGPALIFPASDLLSVYAHTRTRLRSSRFRPDARGVYNVCAFAPFIKV